MTTPQTVVNAAALKIGRLAERLARGYYAHAAAISVASDPKAAALVPGTRPGHIVPVGGVKRKDGSEHVYHFNYYLELARTDPDIAADLARVWLSGAVLAVGDALSIHRYFDRAPELELLRHVRNGIAHGNVFRIENPNSLLKYPAHNGLAAVRSDLGSEFDIRSALDGKPVLFDFMGPADVLDLLLSVGLYLIRMGNGQPLRST